MALRTIIKYPNPRLRKIAEEIKILDEDVKILSEDMAETMYKSNGIGLAATQIDVHKQMIVVDVSPKKDCLYTLINPKIIEKKGRIEVEEGCLSVPDIVATVSRAEYIKIETLNLRGEKKYIEATEILAVCIQHEIDHLKGVVFVDYLSRLKRDRIAKRLAKLDRVVSYDQS